MSVRLESWYVPQRGGPGWFRVRLVNAGPHPVAGFQLAFQSVVQLTPPEGVVLVARTSGHHVLAPAPGTVLAPGGVWDVGLLVCGHRPGHANDGPTGAYLVATDGEPRALRTGVTGRAGHRVGDEPAWCLAAPAGLGDELAGAWATAAATETRLVGPATAVLGGGARPVNVAIDEHLGDGAVVGDDGGALAVAAGSVAGLVAALLSVARRAHAGADPTGTATPRWGWRGLHVDLARQFLPAGDVLDLLDVAAWHGLNRLHLHLTDDEGWRFPVPGYPALTDAGAFRGHGRPIPPLLGSGPAPYGGSYTAADAAAWVERAAALGVELVPEVDLPGHSFAARAAIPALVDPADATVARSVQHLTGNVLDPGLPATWAFLEAVFGSVADLLPGRWLHVGGDEVPSGAWAAAPAARAWGKARGASGTAAIGAAFMAEIVGRARAASGRTIGVWQEAADAGAVAPGAAYVVGWRSAADCRRLATAGHDVVASPADAYYLDMAASPEWYEPGTSWAGSTSTADIEAFDLVAGWSTQEQARLLGVQAAIWTEHAPDRPTLDRLLHPRLAAVADAAWTWTPPRPPR